MQYTRTGSRPGWDHFKQGDSRTMDIGTPLCLRDEFVVILLIMIIIQYSTKSYSSVRKTHMICSGDALSPLNAARD